MYSPRRVAQGKAQQENGIEDETEPRNERIEAKGPTRDTTRVRVRAGDRGGHQRGRTAGKTSDGG
jgi:hypothetical protein